MSEEKIKPTETVNSYDVIQAAIENKWINKRRWKNELLTNKRLQALMKCIKTEAENRNILPNATEIVIGNEKFLLFVSKLDDINETFSKGETILHWTVSLQQNTETIPNEGDPTAVLMLLLLGADPNVRDNLGRTALHWTVKHDDYPIERHQDICRKRKSNAKPKSVRIVEQLLSFNASPNITDIYGATPLCHAVWSKCIDLKSILQPLTDASIESTPDFVLSEPETNKDIRCSSVEQWILEHAADKKRNKERLLTLLTTPGTGFLQHMDEVKMQMKQVKVLFERISAIISREDPLLEFVPTLAGSMSEGTKCQKPDEQDIILRLTKFESICKPEESKHCEEGCITLKFCGDDNKRKEFDTYILDGYLNREEILHTLIKRFKDAFLSMSVWCGQDVLNIFPCDDMVDFDMVILTGDIGNIRFAWHGRFYKHVTVSVDVVPAILIKNWRPSTAVIEDPQGKEVPKETFLILRATIETFHYDMEIYGELDFYDDSVGIDAMTLEKLNGENWDSGSDCKSFSSLDSEESDVDFSTSEVLSKERQTSSTLKRSFENIDETGAADQQNILTQSAVHTYNDGDSASKKANIATASQSRGDYFTQQTPKDINEGDSDNKQKIDTDNSLMINVVEESYGHKTVCRKTELEVSLTKESKTHRGIFEDKNAVTTKIDKCTHIKQNIRQIEVPNPGKSDIKLVEIFGNNDGLNKNEADLAELDSSSEEMIDLNCDKQEDNAFEEDSYDEYEDEKTDSCDQENDSSNFDSYENNIYLTDDDDERGDMAFRVSYSTWENETMRAFPKSVKSAYVLSKALAIYVPYIRAPANRGIHKDSKCITPVNDLFSYLLKMALFSAVKKNHDHPSLKEMSYPLEENAESFVSKTVNETEDFSFHMSNKVNEMEECRSLGYPNDEELNNIAFWINSSFSEIESSAEHGFLSAYFDPKPNINILDKILKAGKQKSEPYPSLLYLRKHCKIVKSLVQIAEN